MSAAEHAAKNGALLLMSLVLLPIDTLVVVAFYIWARFFQGPAHLPKRPARRDGASSATGADSPAGQKTILVTGVGMAKGLAIARLFHRSGHRVVGADFHFLCQARVSRAIDAFYALSHPATLPQGASVADVRDEGHDDPYVTDIVSIVRKEKVDLWISVSDVSAALQDALAKEAVELHTDAKAIQFGLEDTLALHSKDAFIERTRNIGLAVPETLPVWSRDEALQLLEERSGSGNKYLLKPVGVDDIVRGVMAVLPLSSKQETAAFLKSMPFTASPDRDASSAAPGETPPYVLQEYIAGREYCTHALVIRGQVRCFTACPSSDLLMHYSALAPDSPLTQAMLRFTEKQAEAGGLGFTGHMSFDFLVRDDDVAKKEAGGSLEKTIEKVPEIWPIECNPRVHTAIVLFRDTPGLVDAYLSVLSPPTEAYSAIHQAPMAITPRRPGQYYWLGNDLVTLVLLPAWHALSRGVNDQRQLSDGFRVFVRHLCEWKDGTFETSDPWPWWWTYHVFWSARFAGVLLGRASRWSRINVSTGKAFQAS